MSSSPGTPVRAAHLQPGRRRRHDDAEGGCHPITGSDDRGRQHQRRCYQDDGRSGSLPCHASSLRTACRTQSRAAKLHPSPASSASTSCQATRSILRLDGASGFPRPARRAAGFQLFRVRQGLEPNDYKPMASIGAGVQPRSPPRRRYAVRGCQMRPGFASRSPRSRTPMRSTSVSKPADLLRVRRSGDWTHRGPNQPLVALRTRAPT